MPRSPRWLFTNGKIDEGKRTIKKLAKLNNLSEPNFEKLAEVIESENEKDGNKRKHAYLLLFKLKSTRTKNFVLCFLK